MEELVEVATCNSRRTRRSSDPNHSPEFEFWVTRNNPTFPQPNLLSADQLFSHGVLLPLDQLLPADPNAHKPDPEPQQSGSGRPGSDSLVRPFVDDPSGPNAQKADPESHPSGSDQPGSENGPEITASRPFTSSKRWKDIFKKSEKKGENNNSNCKEKKKKDKKLLVGGSSGGVGGAELNINIWPFSRSRSAGNTGRVNGGSGYSTRKVSSAPCSRSNSAGESKSRKWQPIGSPARNGVHLGRASPVWQVRRNVGRNSDKGVKKENSEKGVQKDGSESRRKTPPQTAAGGGGCGGGGGAKARVLSLNVPMCIGYRNQLGCRSDENSAISIAAVADGDGAGGGGSSGSTVVTGGEGVRGSNLFNIKSLFAKKVY